MTHWLFRIASRPESGGGHMRRSLKLVEELLKQGQSCQVFVDPGALHAESPWKGILTGMGNLQVTEENNHFSSGKLVAQSRATKNCHVVIDHYNVAPHELSAIRIQSSLSVFDDFGQDDLPADRFIRQSLISENSSKDQNSRLVLDGAEFVLLPIATTPRKRVFSDRQRPQSILVSAGYRDSINLSAAVLQAVKKLAVSCKVTVVLGTAAPHIEEVRKTASELPDAELLIAPESMEALYQAHDMAVGTGGVSMLERIANGLPALVIRQIDNQNRLIHEAEELGLIKSFSGKDPDQLKHALEEMLLDPSSLNRMSESGIKTLDSDGAKRLANALLENGPT
ncbi:hypothetical protein [Kiloniella litopenaei]|uniref:hypothetical protein n=1 Tax=Kiloniella litopenaei TaxID=1549748 RepID=UPI003BAD8EEE